MAPEYQCCSETLRSKAPQTQKKMDSKRVHLAAEALSRGFADVNCLHSLQTQVLA